MGLSVRCQWLELPIYSKPGFTSETTMVEELLRRGTPEKTIIGVPLGVICVSRGLPIV